jgi:hypothetical protein
MVTATRHEKRKDKQVLLEIIAGKSLHHMPDECPMLMRELYAKETLDIDEWVNWSTSPWAFEPKRAPTDTALIWSIRTNFTWPQKCMKLLLELGASPTQRTRLGRSPMEVLAAARVGGTQSAETSAACAKMLIDAGGLENFTLHVSGQTALHLAAQKRRPTVLCKLMLAHEGVDVLQATPGGDTALHFASAKGWVEVCTLLLDKGADANATNAHQVTVLHEAVRSGSMEVCALLLDRGADVLAKSIHTGVTPEHLALTLGHIHIVAMIRAFILQRHRRLAFAMGHHERLGVDSLVRPLDVEVIRMVLEAEAI